MLHRYSVHGHTLDKLACVHKESTIQTRQTTADAAGLLHHSFGLRLTAAKEQMLIGRADIQYTCIPHNKLADFEETLVAFINRCYP